MSTRAVAAPPTAAAPRPSRRADGVVVGGDDGWGVHYRARALEAAGRDVVLLTVGDHDVPPDASIVAAMAARASTGLVGYAPTPGAEVLREAIAARLRRVSGAPVGPRNVLVTAGGQAALFAAMMLTLDPGDACVLVDPFYATFPQTARAASARVVTVTARAEDGFTPRPEALDAALGRSGARAVLVNSPNNPTGAVYDARTIAALAAVCRAHGAWLISDELYDAQAWDAPHVSPLGLPGGMEGTLVVGSMSKSHGMTGFRVGWLAGPEPLIARAADLALATTYGVAAFVQSAALHALTEREALEAEISARYRRRRDVALATLEGARRVRAVRPAGGMYLMVDVRAAADSATAFAEGLLEATGVAVLPGSSFGEAAQGHVRIALTVAEDRLAGALSRLRLFADG